MFYIKGEYQNVEHVDFNSIQYADFEEEMYNVISKEEYYQKFGNDDSGKVEIKILNNDEIIS